MLPGIFRGALDCHAADINEEMKLAAAEAIASVVSPTELCEDYIIPGVFNPKVAEISGRCGSQSGCKSGNTNSVIDV